MKARIFCTTFLLVGFSIFNFSCKDDEVYEPTPQKPADIFTITLCPNLVKNATGLFPESQNNQEKYAQIFASESQQQIVLTKDTEVYATFVTEGAAMGNVLGYYTYNSSSTPGSPDEIQKELIFPNIDNSILIPGDTRRLGSGAL